MNASTQNMDDDISHLDLGDIPDSEESPFAAVAKVLEDMMENMKRPLNVLNSFERDGREFTVVEVNSEEVAQFIRKNVSILDYGYNEETRRFVIVSKHVPFIVMRFS